MTTWHINEVCRCTATITDADGTLTDPTAITFYYRAPGDATATSYTGTPTGDEIKKDSTGVYYVDLTPDTAGTWYYRFEATGPSPLQVAAETSFKVRESQLV